MADFEKVYLIKFNTTQAQNNIKRLRVGLNDVKRSTDRAGHALTNQVGRRGALAMKNVQVASKRAERGIERIKRASKGMGRGLETFGRNFRRYVALPIGIAAVASLKFARDFNKGMAKISTLMPGQVERIKELKGEILELSKASGVGLGDLTEGVYTAISAWGDSADIIERMNVVVMASQAGYATTEETMGLLATMTGVYGDSSVEAAKHTADLAFITNKLGIKAPFAEMAVSMPKVANSAKELNITQEELFASLGAGVGIVGNVAETSTTMRSVFMALTKETPAMERVVKGLNKEMGTSYSTAGEAIGDKRVGFIGFLTRLKESTSNAKEFQEALGGRAEGLNLALALTGSRAEKYNEILDEMSSKTGQMAEAHKEVTDGVDKAGFSFDKMINRIKLMATRIGDSLLPAISRFLDYIEPLVKYLENMDKEAIDFYLTLGKWALILGAGSKLMTGMFSFSNVLIGMGGKGGSMAMAGGSMLGLIGKAGILAATFAAAYAAGKALSELYFEPAAKKEYETVTTLKDADITAGNIAKSGTRAEKLKGVEDIEKLESELTGGTIDPYIDRVRGFFGQKKGPRSTGRDVGGKAKQILYKSINDEDRVAAGMAAFTGQADPSAGYNFGATTQNPNTSSQVPGQTVNQNIVVNAPNANAREVVKEFERQAGRHLKTLGAASQ